MIAPRITPRWTSLTITYFSAPRRRSECLFRIHIEKVITPLTRL